LAVRSVLLLVVFSTVWATVHSLLASRPVKQRVRERFGSQTDRWYRVGFVGFTGLTLWPILPLLLFLPDRLLYAVRGPRRWLMHAGQLLAALGIAGAVAQTGFGRFVGLDQLLGQAPKAGEPQQAEVLQTTRFYRYVRHPMFLNSILLIWLTPTMTVNLATAFVMATVYFFVGTFLEENRSVQAFGEAYRLYQAQVPRLIPQPGRVLRSRPDSSPE
jgi:protein-S-isoprenylcysteine O-methyltransferase Ste14